MIFISKIGNTLTHGNDDFVGHVLLADSIFTYRNLHDDNPFILRSAICDRQYTGPDGLRHSGNHFYPAIRSSGIPSLLRNTHRIPPLPSPSLHNNLFPSRDNTWRYLGRKSCPAIRRLHPEMCESA